MIEGKRVISPQQRTWLTHCVTPLWQSFSSEFLSFLVERGIPSSTVLYIDSFSFWELFGWVKTKDTRPGDVSSSQVSLFGPHPPRVVPPLRILRDLLMVMSVVRNDGLGAHLQMKRWISLRLLGSGTPPFSSKFIQNKIFLYFTKWSFTLFI